MAKLSDIRAAAKPFIPHLVKQGLSANQIQHELQGLLGAAPRRQWLLQEIREVAGREARMPGIRTTPAHMPVSERLITSTSDWLKDNYRMRFSVVTRDPATGSLVARELHWTRGDMLARGDAEAGFADLLQRSDEEYMPGEVASVTLVGVDRRSGAAPGDDLSDFDEPF